MSTSPAAPQPNADDRGEPTGGKPSDAVNWTAVSICVGITAALIDIGASLLQIAQVISQTLTPPC